MKKIIALILAIMMIASMSVVAFAANGDATNDKLEDELSEGETRDLKADQENVDVIYDVRMGYEVIIPGDFNLEVKDNPDGSTHGEGSGDVIITLAKLPGGKALTVTASGKNAKLTGTPFGNWTLAVENTTDTIAYKIGVDSDQTANDTEDLVRDTGIIVSHTSGTDGAIAPYDAENGTGGRKSALTITTADTTLAGYFKDVITFKTAVN